MAKGICVYAENYNGKIEPVTAELISAAHSIKETTGEPIQVIVAGEKCEALTDQLKQSGADEIYAVKTDRDCAFQEDLPQTVQNFWWHREKTALTISNRTSLPLVRMYSLPS